MIVIAIEHLDVYPGIGHATRELAKLSGFALAQPLHHDLTIGEDLYSRRFEGSSRCWAVAEKKVCDTNAIHYPRSAALDAHTGAAECVAHVGECARAVIEEN